VKKHDERKGRATGTMVELVELRYAIKDHCRSLRRVADHLIRDQLQAAVAALDGAVTTLEDVMTQHHRNELARRRAGALEAKKRRRKQRRRESAKEPTR
jgi:hypothetical protein